MKNKKIQLFFFNIVITILAFAFVPFFSLADSIYNQSACNQPTYTASNCVSVTDDLSSGTTNIPANKSVNLFFGIENRQNLGQTNPCPSGQNLYAFLRHWSGSNYTYIAKTANSGTFSASFNSGSAGQQNKYQGVFYCSNQPVSGVQDSTITNNLNNLQSNAGVNAVVWESAIFNKTTGSQQSQTVQIINSPATNNGFYSPDTRVVITVQNLPANLGSALCTENSNNSNYKLSVSLNAGQSIPFFCFPYPFVVKTGATEGNINMTGGTNTLRITISDSSNRLLAQKEISFKVGSPPNTPGSTSPGQTTANGSGTQPTQLINPLPTDNLLATFLSIAKGFLTGIAIWAVIFIIVGGFRLVVAAGNEEAIAQGKKTITWAVLGLVVALLSFSIVAIVQNLLGVDVEKLDPGTTPQPSSYNITIEKHKV